MKTWATGVDTSGCTRQITVGDIWENMRDDRIHCEILSFNGQWFEVETIDCNNGSRHRARVQDFNEFVNNWQIFSYGIPAAMAHASRTITIKAPMAIDYIPLRIDIVDGIVARCPNCECGAHKLGVKDYARGHSTWCKVYSNDA